jgi:hypothetical protein
MTILRGDSLEPLILQVRNYGNLTAAAVPGRVTSSVTGSGELAFVQGSARLLPPEIAWGGVQDLYRRATGWAEPFSLKGLDQLDPDQALESYQRTTGAVLAQLAVNGPEFAGYVVDTIADFANEAGSLDGLDGPLLTAMLQGSGGDLGLEPWERGLDLFSRHGVPETGGGDHASWVFDGADGRLTDVTPDEVKHVVQNPVDAGMDFMHDLFHRRDTGGSDSGDGDHSGADHIVLGVFLMAAGAAATLVFPPAAAPLEAAGLAQVAVGVDEAVDEVTSGTDSHGEAGRGSHHTRTTRSTTTHTSQTHHYADGTVVHTRTQTTTTRHVVVDVKKGSGGEDSDKAPETGYDPWQGAPGGLDPDCWIPEGDGLASIAHFVGEDTFFLEGLPSLADDGVVLDAGMFQGALDLDLAGRVNRRVALDALGRYQAVLSQVRVRADRPTRVDAVLKYKDTVLRLAGSAEEAYAVSVTESGEKLFGIDRSGVVTVVNTAAEIEAAAELDMAMVQADALGYLRDVGLIGLHGLVDPMPGDDLPI